MDEEKRFHNECQFIDHRTLIKIDNTGYKHYLFDKLCLDHQRTFCRCGWEVGYHFGKKTEKIKYLKN